MEIVIALFLLITGFYVGWNIGANDAANCIGTTVGARIISFREAALLMALFVILKFCLDAIVEASDRAEDACDQLELATLKSMI